MPHLHRFRLACLLGLAAAGLSACAGPGPGGLRVGQQYVDASYDPAALGFAQSRGGIRLEIAGAPFGGDPTVFAERVGGLLEESHFGPEVDFLVAPAEGFDSPYRVALIYDAPLSTSAPQLCRGALPEIAAQADDGMRIVAAYCLGGERVTSAVVEVGPLNGPDDPAFAQATRALGLALFPPATFNDTLRRGADWND
jgi:hypothetical protein